MKVSVVFALLSLSSVGAFTIQTTSTSSSTQLNLFGGGKKDGAKGPGMMDQLAMFKKAQEMAQKKQKLDKELAAMDFEGSSEGGTVKVAVKFVPITNPMDPSPSVEPQGFTFDDAFFASASAEELSAAVEGALEDGTKVTNAAVAEKYQALESDLMEAFGSAGVTPPPS